MVLGEVDQRSSPVLIWSCNSATLREKLPAFAFVSVFFQID
jgi:hypothetical protein